MRVLDKRNIIHDAGKSQIKSNTQYFATFVPNKQFC